RKAVDRILADALVCHSLSGPRWTNRSAFPRGKVNPEASRYSRQARAKRRLRLLPSALDLTFEHCGRLEPFLLGLLEPALALGLLLRELRDALGAAGRINLRIGKALLDLREPTILLVD